MIPELGSNATTGERRNPTPTSSTRGARRDIPNLGLAAREYAEAGQPVFPCHAIGRRAKAPLTSRGLYDATTDLDEIDWWWRRFPDAAIGLPTGAAGVTVLDVDVKNGDGFAPFMRLHNCGLLKGAIRMIRTPSGGIHLYFPGSDLGNRRLANHSIDVRGVGGYVIAPPSRIATLGYAGMYREVCKYPGPYQALNWAECKALLDPPRLPTSPSRNRGSLAPLCDWVRRQPEGNRNEGLYWAACRAVVAGLDPGPLVAAGVEAGLDGFESLATVESAVRRVGGIR